ncbi:MAG: hypothetical protein ACOYLO_00270 [Ferruginibacter sp.]
MSDYNFPTAIELNKNILNHNMKIRTMANESNLIENAISFIIDSITTASTNGNYKLYISIEKAINEVKYGGLFINEFIKVELVNKLKDLCKKNMINFVIDYSILSKEEYNIKGFTFIWKDSEESY